MVMDTFRADRGGPFGRSTPARKDEVTGAEAEELELWARSTARGGAGTSVCASLALTSSSSSSSASAMVFEALGTRQEGWRLRERWFRINGGRSPPAAERRLSICA